MKGLEHAMTEDTNKCKLITMASPIGWSLNMGTRIDRLMYIYR